MDPLIKSWREMGVNVDSLFNPAQDSNEKEQIEFFRKRFLPVSKAAMRLLVVKRDDLKLIRFSIIYKII